MDTFAEAIPSMLEGGSFTWLWMYALDDEHQDDVLVSALYDQLDHLYVYVCTHHVGCWI